MRGTMLHLASTVFFCIEAHFFLLILSKSFISPLVYCNRFLFQANYSFVRISLPRVLKRKQDPEVSWMFKNQYYLSAKTCSDYN